MACAVRQMFRVSLLAEREVLLARDQTLLQKWLLQVRVHEILYFPRGGSETVGSADSIRESLKLSFSSSLYWKLSISSQSMATFVLVYIQCLLPWFYDFIHIGLKLHILRKLASDIGHLHICFSWGGACPHNPLERALPCTVPSPPMFSLFSKYHFVSLIHFSKWNPGNDCFHKVKLSGNVSLPPLDTACMIYARTDWNLQKVWLCEHVSMSLPHSQAISTLVIDHLQYATGEGEAWPGHRHWCIKMWCRQMEELRGKKAAYTCSVN